MLQENSLLTIYTILFRVLQLGFCAPVPWLRLIHSQFNLLCGFIRYKILQTLLSLSPLLVVKRICFVLCVAIKARKEEEARFWGREKENWKLRGQRKSEEAFLLCLALSKDWWAPAPALLWDVQVICPSLSLRPRDSGQTGYKCTVSTAAAGLGSRLQLVGAWTDSVGCIEEGSQLPTVRHNIDTQLIIRLQSPRVSHLRSRLRSPRQCCDHTPGAALLIARALLRHCPPRPAHGTWLATNSFSGPGSPLQSSIHGETGCIGRHC